MFTRKERPGKHLLRGSKGGKEEYAVANDRMRELEERYEDYTVYDRDGDKIGKVDDLFVDETDREEYLGVRMGLFGLSGTTLIPMEIVRVNDQDRAIEVSDSKEHVKDAPTYSDDDDVTGEFEDRIRSHFGLDSVTSSAERGSYGRYSGVGGSEAAADGTRVEDNTMRGDQTETAQHADRPMGGAQDKDVYDERESEPLGQEEYRNREDMDLRPWARRSIATARTWNASHRWVWRVPVSRRRRAVSRTLRRQVSPAAPPAVAIVRKLTLEI